MDNIEIAEELYTSIQTRKILTEKVIGVEILSTEDKKILCAVLIYKDNKVYIPYDEMGIENANKDIINSMIGANIHFIVTRINKEKNEIIASRKAANETIRKIELKNLNEGSIISGNILSVNRNNLIVEICGIDYRISKEEVDWYRINNLKEYTKPGEQCSVLIKSISEAGIPEISLKEAKEDPYKNITYYFKPKGVYLATVNGTTEYGVFVELKKGIVALCSRTIKDEIFKKGDKVVIKVDDINKVQRKVYGRILRKV